ncbi:probable ubiquitin-conjugating enzyme E2 23 [Elaeis guineensis]|uniref:E2 ubiquitin-conjugating enzyme n=1 Tax=Elaeis guineensis var. tenera TaxID=51953 RepID=A0A6I9R916_ELAGV|nr:probable ubiquitin-conjugating enzyme E2 23 [Elaeis guineensis]
MEPKQHLAGDGLSKCTNSLEVNNLVDPMELATDGTGSVVEKSCENGEAIKSKELAGSLPNEAFVYRQDVVRCKKNEGLLGVVMEVAGDSDSEGSITDDSDSEEDEGGNGGGSGGGGGDNVGDDDNGNEDDGESNDSLPEGQIRVTWTDGSETTENISNITVVDRNFLHGDMVASASDPTGQMGLVVDVNIMVDLLTANGEIIKNVSSRDLKRIREFTVGDFVVFGPWLGRVDDVLDNVTVLFDDGSVCKVVKADPLRLKPVTKPVIEDASCPYYPGQRVRAVSSSVFKTSRWLSGLWKANRLEGTVVKIQTASVVVYWIASAYLGIGTNSTTVPAEEQNPENLTLLSCFSYANWQLADWCLLPSPPQPSFSADDTSKASKEDSGTEVPEQAASFQDETAESSQVASLDVLNLQSASGYVGDGYCENTETTKNLEGNPQPQYDNPVVLDKMNNLGENTGTESNALPECCSCSTSSVSKEPNHESWPAYRKKLRKVLFKRDKKSHRRNETFERALLIVNTVTKVDVAWQDGTREFGLESTSLIPIHSPNDHEFFPEQYVVEKASNEGDDSSDTKRVGVVRSVNSRERTACVRWLMPVSRPEELQEFDCDEVVSAYELDGHPDYDYCYGDVVVRLPPISTSGDTSNIEGHMEKQEQQVDPVEAEGDGGRENDGAEQVLKDEDSLNFACTWVGNIIALEDGDIEVQWADGTVSKVGPQAIYVVGREDDGDSFDGGSEVSDDGASWETVDENEMDAHDKTEKEGDLQSPVDNFVERETSTITSEEDNNAGRNGPLSMPLAAIGYVTRLATGLFSLGRKQSDPSDLDHMIENESESGEILKVSEKATNDEASYEESEALDVVQNVHKAAEVHSDTATAEDAEEKMEDVPDGSTSDDPHSFKHFDIAENPSDHHFLGGNGQNTGGRKWVKKVQQEWSILEKNLPDAIYVRVYEDRMDLLRAVIIGACGTPYQDGLFFFDFHLSPDYPQVPPSAYYHSGGLRVNPNLYVDGKVCLSLLNTWTGKGNEVWDPSSSSILQVLVSLQGLVLNSKPYFNEAGYEKQVGTVEGEKNSLPYNENTYLLNLKTMLYLLRRPPMHFEEFVRDHFRRRGHYILKACEAYMEGCVIGSLTKDACKTEKSREHSCSVGFKLTLAKILPRLIMAFKEVGVDCHQFEHLQKPENIPES